MDEKITSNKSQGPHPLKKKLKKKSFVPKTPTPPSYGNPEIDAMFAKINAMKDDLDSKLNKICEMTGMSTKEINSYLNNPNNFSPQQWERMERAKKNVEEKLYLGLGLGIVAKQQKAKKAQEKQTRERRGKMIGARKKWMQM